MSNEPTWVDFYFYEMSQFWLLPWANITHEFPVLIEYFKAFEALPGVREYIKEGFEKKRAFNNSMAKLNNNVWYKIWYFPVYGRGEALKMLMAKAGVQYEVRNVSMEEWPSIKPKMPNGVMPVL